MTFDTICSLFAKQMLYGDDSKASKSNFQLSLNRQSIMENIFRSSKCFLVLAKLLGLFPISFDPEEEKIPKMKWHDTIVPFSSALILTYLVSVYYIYKEFCYSDSLILMKAWNISMHFEYSSHLFLYVYQLRKCKNIVKFLKQVKQVDEHVRMLNTFRLDKTNRLSISGKTCQCSNE